MQTLLEQVAQAYQQYQTKPTSLAKRQFLMTIFNTNRVLFYKLFSQHVVEFMPIVYDPTIAEDIEKYSDIFTQPQNAAYLSIDTQDSTSAIKSALTNAANGRQIRLIVVTDAQEILGIGDWGVNGVDICVGKLMVYTAAAGIDPREVLPVVLDVGTDNQKLLNNPNYLGNRHHRVNGSKYYGFVDKFVKSAEATFPDMYLHFEDFGRDHAANLLNKYRQKYTVFNDDIQGTGIIILASILGALNISHEKLTDQRYLCFGAGTAGTGIANHVYREFIQQGLSPQEAKQHFYLVDKQGLLFKDDPTLTPQQKVFARDKAEFKHPERLTDLLNVVKAVHPTILVGTSTAPGTFTKAVVQEMAAHTKRPVICPISNPTKLAEAKPQDLLNWTDGKALIATGVPYPDIKANNGITYQIGQANNALVYPGVGLGVLAVHATRLSDQMISAAAHSLGGIVNPKKPGAAVLPPVSKLNQFSNNVAIAVAKTAVKQGLTKNKININDVPKLVKDTRWNPHY
ncbi:MAG: NAD-dependent malic enzyme [Acetilactobacillus jinshanensis]